MSEDGRSRSTVALHRSFEKLQRCLAIPVFRGKNFEHLTFVVHGTPEVMRLAVDPDEHLIQVPSPSGIRSMLVDTPLPDIRCEHWTEPVPPETYCLVADIDVTLKQQVFDLPKRQRITIISFSRSNAM